MTSMTAHNADNYTNAITDALAQSPVDENALIGLLQTFDSGGQDARIKAALKEYAGQRRTTAADVALIDAAVAAL